MSSASWALQQALVGILNADSLLQKLIGNPPRLYDAVPRSAVFPYLVLAEDRETAWDTACDSGSVHRIVFHAFARSGGRREIKLIAAAVVAALAGGAIAPVGFHLVNWQFVEAQYRRETDGRSYRAVIEFRAVTESEN